MAAIALTACFVPESRAPRARGVDAVGQMLVIVALASVTYAIIEAPQAGWTSSTTPGLFARFVVAIEMLLAYEPRRIDPLLAAGAAMCAGGVMLVGLGADTSLGWMLAGYFVVGLGFWPWTLGKRCKSLTAGAAAVSDLHRNGNLKQRHPAKHRERRHTALWTTCLNSNQCSGRRGDATRLRGRVRSRPERVHLGLVSVGRPDLLYSTLDHANDLETQGVQDPAVVLTPAAMDGDYILQADDDVHQLRAKRTPG